MHSRDFLKVLDKMLLKKARRQLLRQILHFVGYQPILYKVCTHYVGWYRGDSGFSIEDSGELKVIQKLLPSCSVVFDVGANSGDWTRAGIVAAPEADFHLFEPSRRLADSLRDKVFSVPIVVRQMAVSDRCGTATLTVDSGNSTMNTLVTDGRGSAKWSEHEEVMLTTIDSYCQLNNIGKVDFLKLDIEGHELRALKGAQWMIEKRAIRYIQFEFNSCAIFEHVFLRDIFDFLKPYYTLYKITPHGLMLVEKWQWSLESFGQTNWLATSGEAPSDLCVGKALFVDGWYTGRSHE